MLVDGVASIRCLREGMHKSPLGRSARAIVPGGPA